MIRSKRKWVCECGKEYLTWQGKCNACGVTAGISEVILEPEKPTASQKQKSILARSKRTERKLGKRMLEIDGADPRYKGVASSTGRVGHITSLQFDTVSKNYANEVKNRLLPKWLIEAWVQIQQRGIDLGKYPQLYMEPSNLPKTFPINGRNEKTAMMAIITPERHEELISKEKMLEEILNGRE